MEVGQPESLSTPTDPEMFSTHAGKQSANSRGRHSTDGCEPKTGSSPGGGGGGRAAPAAPARPHTALELRRASVSSCVKVGGPDCSALRFQPARPTPRAAGITRPLPSHRSSAALLPPRQSPRAPGQFGPTGSARGSRPRPVLTPAVTADFSATPAERSRLRPLGCRLRNSLDRSRESVAEAAELL
jgi:hypothetical protein